MIAIQANKNSGRMEVVMRKNQCHDRNFRVNLQTDDELYAIE